ncbi:hypothetical protein Q9L58_003762 [Maublancomyces gigas]|uniref:Uncharacterized protein n=1 Tax=Discina gigas TaxID=1032678 RepID=A0ABR3GN20_9PEZI
MNTLTTLFRVLPRRSASLNFTRHKSNSRRHTKLLQLPPHPSFLLTEASPTGTHIIRNPPSAAPSVYSTPSLFLPKDDPRRVETEPLAQGQSLPPPLKTPYVKKYHLEQKDFDEIRALRTGDPNLWTRAKLAAKFETSQFFIGMVCEASPERKAEMQTRLANIKGRWGQRKIGARLERKRRRAGWGGADGL